MKYGKIKKVPLEKLYKLNNIEAQKTRLREERARLFQEFDFIRLKFVGKPFTEEEAKDFEVFNEWFMQCKKIEEDYEMAKMAILNPPLLLEKYK